MKRGFLNRPKANKSTSTSVGQNPTESGPRTRELSKNPCVVQCDYNLPIAPSYLYVPQGKNTTVVIDGHASLIDIAKWDVRNTILPPIEQPAFEIKPVEGKGLGMVATRRISAGELLVNERPVYTERKRHPTPIDYTESNGFFFLGALDRLSETSKSAIYALKNSYGPDKHQLFGILRTNVQEHTITEANGQSDSSEVFVSIFPLISRANHACTPNSNYYFSVETFAGELHAVKDIEIGEEITVQYVDPLDARSTRRELLKKAFFFDCECGTCSLTDWAASDARRSRIAQVTRDLETNPAAPSPTLPEVKEAVELATQERLIGQRAILLFLGGTKLIYLGEKRQSMEWLKRAKNEFLIFEGQHSATYKGLLKYVTI
ncbi:SET domain-containing protein [Gymnopus androsaceus JB14]|uniref:SET domain-containing protein n=1 Tax=Gymnopus androsaceus JB14 TaxID=1447944 RepID=A0A6A4HUU5_9AGAR|nr:SET domain-containing protein [Gymnopus androsaceus JB14]